MLCKSYSPFFGGLICPHKKYMCAGECSNKLCSQSCSVSLIVASCSFKCSEVTSNCRRPSPPLPAPTPAPAPAPTPASTSFLDLPLNAVNDVLNTVEALITGLLNQAGRRKRQASITTCSSFITNVNALLNAIEKGLDSWSLLAIEFMSLEVSDIGSCSATDGQNLLDTQLNLNILQLKVEYSLAATTPGTTAAGTTAATGTTAAPTTNAG